MTNPTIRYDNRLLAVVFDDLPELTGSDKQVAWAMDIRRDMLQAQIAVPFGALISHAVQAGNADMIPSAIVKLNAQMGHVLTLSSAKFWIDSRNVSLKSVKA